MIIELIIEACDVLEELTKFVFALWTFLNVAKAMIEDIFKK